MTDPNLEKLERQYEQAKARLQSARARKATQDRKLDARRKIILGGALIEKASRDPEATRLLMSLVAGLARMQDRKAFDGWSPFPAPETGGNAGGVSGPTQGAQVRMQVPEAAGVRGTEAEGDAAVTGARASSWSGGHEQGDGCRREPGRLGQPAGGLPQGDHRERR